MEDSENGEELAPGTQVRTEDGFIFTVQTDGSLTDGDLVYDSIEQLREEVSFEVIQGNLPEGT
jgi:hypothetical protein